MSRIKLIVVLLNLPRFLPHLLVLLFYRNNCECDIYAAIEHRKWRMGGVILPFLYLMVFDSYYRAIFYKRIGNIKYLISFLAPPESTFIIGTYMPVGKGMLAVHPFATVLNATSIGDYFTIKNNVTIGMSTSGCPTIGNNVTVNVNSVIVGGVTIGDNVTIGASTLILKDVPSNCVVVGNPAFIIRKDGEPCRIKL